MTKELICIGCPMGCRLTVETENNEFISVKGNACKNGEKYAREEITSPKRVLTTTVPVEGRSEMLSVRSDGGLDKRKIFEYMSKINSVKVLPPVYVGDIIIKDIDGCGIDIIATKNID